MRTRISRAEQKERTRADLVAAARRVFGKRGFHGATLEEIAEAAGFSKGAVYSNFAGKDELFLAVLDDQFEQRLRTYRDLLPEQETVEGSITAVTHVISAADERDPEWSPLLLEFWAHASRRPRLRRELAKRRERFLDGIAELIEELGARHGVTFRLPARDVARGSGALLRGISMERTLDAGTVSTSQFEEMHLAYMRGLTVAAADSERRNDVRRDSRSGTRRTPARARR